MEGSGQHAVVHCDPGRSKFLGEFAARCAHRVVIGINHERRREALQRVSAGKCVCCRQGGWPAYVVEIHEVENCRRVDKTAQATEPGSQFARPFRQRGVEKSVGKKGAGKCVGPIVRQAKHCSSRQTGTGAGPAQNYPVRRFALHFPDHGHNFVNRYRVVDGRGPPQSTCGPTKSRDSGELIRNGDDAKSRCRQGQAHIMRLRLVEAAFEESSAMDPNDWCGAGRCSVAWRRIVPHRDGPMRPVDCAANPAVWMQDVLDRFHVLPVGSLLGARYLASVAGRLGILDEPGGHFATTRGREPARSWSGSAGTAPGRTRHQTPRRPRAGVPAGARRH